MKALRIAWRVVKWAAFFFVAANLAYACSPQVNIFVNGIIENWNLDDAALGIPGIHDARMDVANYGLNHGSNDPGRVVFIHGKMTEGQFRAYVQSLAGVVDTSEQNIVCSFQRDPYVGGRWQEFFPSRFPARRGPGSGTASPELPLPRRAALPSWSATVFGKKGEPHAKAVSAGLLRLGSFEADLTKLDQLVDRAQTQALGAAVLWLAQNSEDGETVPELVARAEERVAKAGLDGLSRRSGAEFARFRPQELAAALYRLRRLGMRPGNRG